MKQHLQRDLDRLRRELLLVGTLVEEALSDALIAYVDRRLALAEKVIEGDAVIDDKEVEVEDECLKILALHAPVAADLRYVVAILKVNNDLERMGDLATTIAKRARFDIRQGSRAPVIDFVSMAESVRTMVRMSLDSLVNKDTELALRVGQLDEEVDDAHKKNYGRVKECLREHPDATDACVGALSVSRSLERIADLATNIAEDVVFLVDGKVVRHARGELD